MLDAAAGAFSFHALAEGIVHRQEDVEVAHGIHLHAVRLVIEVEVLPLENHSSGEDLAVEVEVAVTLYDQLVAEGFDRDLFFPVELHRFNGVNSHLSVFQVQEGIYAGGVAD